MNDFIQSMASWLTRPHTLTMNGWEWLFWTPMVLGFFLVVGGWVIVAMVNKAIEQGFKR